MQEYSILLLLFTGKILFLTATGFSLCYLLRLRFSSLVEFIGVSVISGYIVIYLFMLLLNCCGMIYPGIVHTVFLIGIAGFFFFLVRGLFNRCYVPPKHCTKDSVNNTAHNLLIAFLSLAVIITIFHTFYLNVSHPVLEMESYRWLRPMRISAIYHKHIITWDNCHYFQQYTSQIINQFSFLIGDLDLIKLDYLIHVIIIWLFFSLFSRQIFKRDYSPVMMALLLCTGVTHYMLAFSLVKGHFYMGSFGICGVWLYIRLLNERFERGMALLSGLCLGIAVSIGFHTVFSYIQTF